MATRTNSVKVQATIFKKCSTEYHRPDTNKACIAGTCQHTCAPSQVERCAHKWTLRYSANGTQREKSYATLKLAQDAQLKLHTTKREQGRTFIDPALADETFGPNAEQFIKTSTRLKAGADTRAGYLSVLRCHVGPRFGARSLASMATEATADEVQEWLPTIPQSRRHIARMLIVWTMDAMIRSGKITSHRLTGITVDRGQPARARRAADDDDESLGFVFITDDQARQLADGCTVTTTTKAGKTRTHTHHGVGLAVWLQRTMGLRIREALGAEKSDFKTRRDGSHYLKLRSQSPEDGQAAGPGDRVPLKHRKADEGRDVPVPPAIWELVERLPDGPLCPGVGSRYLAYNTAWNRFSGICKTLGIEGFTTHSLRHQFASESLEDIGPENVAVLAATLGHKSVETTLRLYVHPTPNATARMVNAMNARGGTLPHGGGQGDAQ
jgi:hypothetical protein